MFRPRTRTGSSSVAQSPPLTRPGPEYFGGSMDRTSSRSTTNDSHDAQSTKKDKRRSGLFGLLGKKDKDEKSHEPQPPSAGQGGARSTFHIAGRDSQDNRYPTKRMSQSQSMSGPQMQSFNGRPSAQSWQSDEARQQQTRVVSAPQHVNGGAPMQGQNQFRGPVPPGPERGLSDRSQSMGFALQQQPQRPGSQSSMGTSTATHGANTSNSPSASDQTQEAQHRGVSSHSTPRASPGPPPHRMNSGDANRPTTIGQAPGTDLPPPAAWTRPFQPIVELIGLQPAKVYGASPPELEMIVAKTSSGAIPKQGTPGSANNDWDSSWLQLAGTSLSLWSMKETRAAAAKGEKVPPAYYNVTDSSLEILAPLPPPPHRPTSRPHPHVFSLNTAGSNRMLFSCPTQNDLAQWVTALRLAAYEKSRLEEIYTGHILKIFYSGRPGQLSEPASPLSKGKLEGWVRVRVMGGTEWKRLWAVLSVAAGDKAALKEEEKDGKDKRRRSFFGIGGDKEKEQPAHPVTESAAFATAYFYTAPPRGMRPGKATGFPPVLTMTNVTQAFAVYPEHLELIGQSNLLKVVGRVGGDMVMVEGRQRESGWAMIMPERPEEDTHVLPPPLTFPDELNNVTLLDDMLRWVVGFHDVFKLYGRPERYTWDPQNPQSMYFAYPHGPQRGRLFIDTSAALAADFRTEHLSEIRRGFQVLVHRQMPGQPLGAPSPPPASEKANYALAQASPPRQQPVRNSPLNDLNDSRKQAEVDAARTPPSQPQESSFRLPPLSFDEVNDSRTPGNGSREDGPRSLTPITERTDIASRNNSTGTTGSVKHFSSVTGVTPADRVKALSGSSARTLVSREASDGSTRDHGQRLSSIDDVEIVASPEQQAPAVRVKAPGELRTVASVQSAVPKQTIMEPATPSTWSQETGNSPQTVTNGRSEAATPVLAPVAPPRVITPGATPPQVPAPYQLRTSPENTKFLSKPHASPEFTKAVAPPQPSARSPSAEQSPTSSSQPSHLLSPKPLRVSSSSEHLNQGSNLQDEPAARYLMNMVDDDETTLQQQPTTSSPLRQGVRSNNYGSSEEDEYGNGSPEMQTARVRPSIITDFAQPVARQPSDPSKAKSPDLTRPLGRKPSGARAMPPRRQVSDSAPRPLPPVIDQGSPAAEEHLQPGSQLRSSTSSHADLGDDAFTALSFLDKQPSPEKPRTAPLRTNGQAPSAFPSSFAPTKSAVDRKARADAAAQQHHEALTMPGRGKRPGQARRGAWSGSSDEDDEDEDEDEDEHSPVRNKHSRSGLGVGQPPRGQPVASRSASRTLPPIPDVSDQRGSVGPRAAQHLSEQSRAVSMAAHAGLPTIPRIGGDRDRRGSYGNSNSAQSQSPSDSLYNPAFNEARAQTRSPGRQDQSQARPKPVANRSSMWNANFDAEHGLEGDKSDKFVTIEPSAHLTKAFAPHGLLQAGLQDKEDRSARKQEELARETGSSLINVPSKPPPPQSGLLGAITAHERDRQHAGGVGATMTDRERERRLAEERQRKIDELQKQQLEHMSQYGGGQDMYGAGMPQRPFSGMGAPSGLGAPSAMGYPGGNPGMMWQGGMNPYAQQQAMMAAQFAYQQAMMAMSHAGSQVGDPSQQDPRAASPMMSGYGGFPGMGMGMMSPPMGMPWGQGSPMLHPMSTGGGMPYEQASFYGGLPHHSQAGAPTQAPTRPRSRVQSMQEDPHGHRRGKSGGSPRSSPLGSPPQLPRQGSSNPLPRLPSSSQLAQDRNSPNNVS